MSKGLPPFLALLACCRRLLSLFPPVFVVIVWFLPFSFISYIHCAFSPFLIVHPHPHPHRSSSPPSSFLLLLLLLHTLLLLILLVHPLLLNLPYLHLHHHLQPRCSLSSSSAPYLLRPGSGRPACRAAGWSCCRCRTERAEGWPCGQPSCHPGTCQAVCCVLCVVCCVMCVVCCVLCDVCIGCVLVLVLVSGVLIITCNVVSIIHLRIFITLMLFYMTF